MPPKKKAAVAPVFAACDDGDVDALLACLAADPGCIGQRNKDGWQPLHQAAYSGELACVAALLKAGAKAAARCSDGDTPAHYASAQGHVDVLRALAAAADCDLEATDNDGESVLDVATGARVRTVLRGLIDAKAARAEEDEDGEWEEAEAAEAEEALGRLAVK